MRRIQDLISEDTNQFGPGTDLIVAVLAVLMVVVTISSRLYNKEIETAAEYKRLYEQEKAKVEALEKEKQALRSSEGNFEPAKMIFPAGDFSEYPVTQLLDEDDAHMKIESIVLEYQAKQVEYPYIFIIGHANRKDALVATDRSEKARLQRNWGYAGMRAAVIASLLQEGLGSELRDRIVLVSTGELDMRRPEDPESQENAWVEVVFGKKWKLPARLPQ